MGNEESVSGQENDRAMKDDESAVVNGDTSKEAIENGSAIRTHIPTTRTSSSSINRSRAICSFNTSSLRIRNTHYPPTRRSSNMDNLGAPQKSPNAPQRTVFPSQQQRPSPTPPPTTAGSRSGNKQVLRQRSAVTFTNTASAANSAGGNLAAAATANSADSAADKTPLAALLALSAYQQQQLVQTWPRIQQSGGHAAGAEIFRKLTSKFPPIKETFQKADVVERLAPRARGYDIYKEHGRLLFDVFHTAINALTDSAEDVTEMCRGYGARHLSLRGEGFQSRMWDDLSELLVEHITRLDVVRKHRELMRAWTALIMFLVEKMKDGYEHGLRKCSSPAAVTTSSFVYRNLATSLSLAEDDLESLDLADKDNPGDRKVLRDDFNEQSSNEGYS